MNEVKDLNKLVNHHDCEGSTIRNQDNTTTSSNGDTIVYFRNIEDHLVSHIRRAQIVVGCVAWLTNKRILEALSDTRGVALVVQKEDFLRPDIGSGAAWKAELRKRYDSLPGGPTRYEYDNTVLPCMSYCGDPNVQPVRCVGNHNRDKKPAFPRMHNKFVLFCRVETKRTRRWDVQFEQPEYDEETYVKPYEVWTGSFNFTENAGKSLENAIVFRDPAIVSAYFVEFGHIASYSEPLDWKSDWVEPEWRLGS